MRSIIMMTHKKSNGSLHRPWSSPLIRCHFVGLIVAALFLLMVSSAQSQTKLAFQGMWPETNGTQCFNTPKDVTVDDKGNIYVLDSRNHRVRKFSQDGQFLDTWGTLGTGEGQFIDPISIAYHPDGYIYVADSGWSEILYDEVNRVQKFTLEGKYAGEFGNWYSDEVNRSPQGMAIDNIGNLYIAILEEGNINWIYKYNANDELMTYWKINQVEGWKKDEIVDISIEPDGNILALVNTHLSKESPYPADKKAYPVHRFTPNGDLIDRWEITPPSDPEKIPSILNGGLAGICVDSKNKIFISHIWGPWIKQFSKNGDEIDSFGGYGSHDGEFNQIYGIALDKEGNLLVADSDNHRIQKLTTDGEFISSIQCSGVERGQFIDPQKILIGPNEKVYVADQGNGRVQVFEKNGKYVLEIPNEENTPVNCMAIDDNGGVYVGSSWGQYIRKFDASGKLIGRFRNSVDDSFDDIVDMAFAPNHHLYIADNSNRKIYKMTPEGEILDQWGEEGSGLGKFGEISGLAISSDGNIFVLDHNEYVPDISLCPEAYEDPENNCSEMSDRVQKFDLDGNILDEYWGIIGHRGEQYLYDSKDITLDPQGNIWITQGTVDHLHKFSPDGEWLETLAEHGDAAGMFSGLNGIIFDPDGRLYTTETGNSRVQVFSVIDEASGNTEKENRAIIVAGGGPYQGNTLWNATQMCANMAYRTLLYQGYTRDRIHYLTWDTNLDLDGNAKLDDVDAMPSNGALKTALETWTKGADNLLVYMVDHGGDGQFRMGKDEVMSASDFSGWFSTANQNASGNTILIYDACRSGSFIPALASTADNNDNPPIVITSSGDDESAYFTNNGTLSFSYQFWSQIQNGMTLRNAFFSTQNAIQFAYGNQTPLLDDNGNGIANEDDDGERSKGIAIGSGIISAGDLPTMGNATLEPSTLNGDTSATLRSENVTDADGIERVWAVISPPDFLVGNPENPVTDLPTLTLKKIENSTWEGQYTDFKATGTYKIALYAEDQHGEISLPIPLTLVQSGGDPSANISKDLFTMKIPCLQMGDGWLRPTFRMITPTGEASGSGIPLSGFFYELDPQNLGILSSCPSGSAELLPNFDIRISRVVYERVAFSITMRFQGDLSNSDLYWELDLATFTVVP